MGRHEMARDANVATIPIGYADGVRRNLSGLDVPVLIGGQRRPIIGTVTMDQLMVDCGDDEVAIGDEIGYEMVCGIGPRVPRRYHRSGLTHG